MLHRVRLVRQSERVSNPKLDDALASANALLEHRRELFKIEDGRIAAVETQASAVIAATIAVLAFFFASDDYALGVWIAALGIGAVALVGAIIARTDRPMGTGSTGEERRRAVLDADDHVNELDAGKAEPVGVRLACTEAWKTRYRSAACRLTIKRRWLHAASLALAALFLLALGVSAA